MESIVVPSEQAGRRLDRFLAERFPEHSRTRLQAWIRSGAVTLDGVPATRPAAPLEPGQRIALDPEPGGPDPEATSALPLAVLHEEPSFCVLDKPAGQAVHPTGERHGDTTSELLVQRYGDLPCPQGEDRPGIVHRLDARTSGVLVIARTEAAAESLRRQFREREVEKTYVALVRGVPRFLSDWITAPLLREKGERTSRTLRRDDPDAPLPEGAREAETYWEVREAFPRATLLEVRPRTGRTHQIRVHLESIGLPIVGDELYSGRTLRRSTEPWPAEAPRPHRQALHAERLAFAHPETGERVAFRAPWPEDFAALVGWLRAHR